MGSATWKLGNPGYRGGFWLGGSTMGRGTGQFLLGVSVGVILSVALGMTVVTSGLVVSRPGLARIIEQDETAVMVRHGRRFRGLLEARLDPMMDADVAQLARKVFVQVDGHQIALSGAAAAKMQAILERQGKGWIGQDLQAVVASPRGLTSLMASWAVAELSHQPVPVTVDGLSVALPLRLSPGPG